MLPGPTPESLPAEKIRIVRPAAADCMVSVPAPPVMVSAARAAMDWRSLPPSPMHGVVAGCGRWRR